MPDLNSVYERIITLLSKHDITYTEYDHAPILTYEDAEREKVRLGWNGVESKNVFMRGADGSYYVMMTVAGQRVDFAKLKELLGVKLSIASEDDVRTVVECVPGCVVPFGYADHITLLLDKQIFQHTDYLFSPGVTTKTVQLNIQDIKNLLASLPNKIVEI